LGISLIVQTVEFFAYKQCLSCTGILNSLGEFLRQDDVQDEFCGYLTTACLDYSLAKDSVNVCPGIVTTMFRPALEMFADMIQTRYHWCKNFCPLQAPISRESVVDYAERVLSDKPDSIKNDDFINNLYR
jgi:hypothetical protein